MFIRLAFVAVLTVASLGLGVTSAPAAPLAAAIVLTKTASTAPTGCGATNTLTVFEGTQVTYCYTVRNTGDVTLTAHSLIDTQLGTILNAFAFSLAPGASTFITRTATLTQTTTNAATWTASDGVVSVVAGSTATVTVTPAADVSISKTATPARVPVGGVLNYSIVVTNTGPATATTVVVNDVLPSGLGSPVIATTLGTCSITNLVVTCQLGSMGAGSSAAIAIAATAPSSRGVITNTASVSSPNDPSTANNSASASTAILAPGLRLTKTVGANASACATTNAIPVPTTTVMTYCYTVQNTGDYTFTTHTLTDTQLGTIVSGLNQTLAPGASTFITRSEPVSQTTTNVAAWTASDGTVTSTASSSATVGVGPVSDVVITKLDSPDPVTISHRLTYTLIVTNIGPNTATNVTITDVLPPGVSLSGLSFNPAFASETDGTITFSVSELARGESIPLSIGVKAPATIGVITNTATVTATNDYLATNNTAQITTNVVAYMLYMPLIARSN